MARFEHTIRSDGVGQRLAAELHPQALRTPLHSRRTRVVPDRFATKEGDGFFHRAMITQPARARFGSRVRGRTKPCKHARQAQEKLSAPVEHGPASNWHDTNYTGFPDLARFSDRPLRQTHWTWR